MDCETSKEMIDDHHQCGSATKEEQQPSARSHQKVNSFSIDSLLSDSNKTSGDNRCSGIQCSNFVVNEEGPFSSLSGRLHYEPNVVTDSVEEHHSSLRDSPSSCPSASYSRSFSEGGYICLIQEMASVNCSFI